MNRGISRRRFLSLGAFTILSGVAPSLCFGGIRRPQPREKALSFYNYHTGESLDATYWAEGKYLAPALKDINHLLRDYRSGEIKRISPRLLDLLYAIKAKLGTRQSFHVISGYRSTKTNALLRKRSRGVAKKSLHTEGKAVDSYIPGVSLSVMRSVALDLRAGGVGYYPQPHFIHIDIGPVRSW